MPYLIGIDEAGYGPNLGPFVMTAVVCRVGPDLAVANLWKTLHTAVRRQHDSHDDRILIDDSKRVYSSARGIEDLEHGVLGTVGLLPAPGAGRGGQNISALPLATFLEGLSRTGPEELRAEPWYTGDTHLPVACDAERVRIAADKFHHACREKDITWESAASVVVCPRRFNALIDQWGSKGAILALSMTELIRTVCQSFPGEDSLTFFIDKHGGRNQYSAILQHAFGKHPVIAREEGARRSVYHVLGTDRAITLTFQPRADAAHLGVALASMVSKYLREILMGEFNRFWRQHLPELKPTAGYPTDAGRFLQEIQTVMEKLGIDKNRLWRNR